MRRRSKTQVVRSKRSESAAAALLTRARKLALTDLAADRKQAFDLLVKAAARDNPEAQYALGTWYLFGRHVKKDLVAAAKYLSRAASAGFPAAMFDLAILYEKGTGVKKSASKAFGLYVRAAGSKDKEAIHSVGRCLYHGIGTSRNPRLADLILDYAEVLNGLSQSNDAAK